MSKLQIISNLNNKLGPTAINMRNILNLQKDLAWKSIKKKKNIYFSKDFNYDDKRKSHLKIIYDIYYIYLLIMIYFIFKISKIKLGKKLKYF